MSEFAPTPQEVGRAIVRIDNALDELQKVLIVGNGRPPLTERVATLEAASGGGKKGAAGIAAVVTAVILGAIEAIRTLKP